MMSQQVQGARVLVCGGTGSLGQRIVHRLLLMEPDAVTVFSRDEKKQMDMRRAIEDPRLRLVIGDIRDRQRIREALDGIDLVINAAALKHVSVCEAAPTEAVLTNVVGATNIRLAALAAGVRSVLAISTDKAVKPVNVLGMTKAIQERVILAPTPAGHSTRFLAVRYGNVLGSRGSVVPVFCDCVLRGKPLTITNPTMTRFILTLDEAVDLILATLEGGVSGELWVRRSPAVYIGDLAQAVALGLGGSHSYPMRYAGIRPGEKMHEVLVSAEEKRYARTDKECFRITKDRADITAEPELTDYTSLTERKLSIDEILELLRKEGWFSRIGGRAMSSMPTSGSE